MKIQTKTTLLFTILISIILIVLESAVYYLINKAAQNDFYKRVELRAKISAKFRFEKDKVSTEAFHEIQREYLEKLPQEEAYVFSADSAGYQMPYLNSHNIDQHYIMSIIEAKGGTVHKHVKFRHYAGLFYQHRTGNFIIIKSATNQYGLDLMKKLRRILILTLVFSVILSYLIGQYFSKRSFYPFRKITGRVQQINENNLHLRLEGGDGSDEVAELTGTFNEMLDRLETAFEAQNNFISNASHELRTPLTAIAGEADFALSKKRSTEEYEQSLQQVSLQAGKLQQLIQGLLNLAKTGFDGKKVQRKKIRLDELIYDVKANADNIISGNKIRVSIIGLPDDVEKMTITGSYDLLKLAFSNILLNACKYSNNEPVLLDLLFEESLARVIVADTGIGIPASEIKYIYDPFFRASNTKDFKGYGIGMPLARNIIRLHKGSIEVRSKQHVGTIVEVCLPLV